MMQDHPTHITCSACGTSPINHTNSRLLSTVSLIFSPFDRLFSKLISFKQSGSVVNTVTAIHFQFLRLIGMSTINRDSEKAATGRSKVIWEEATARNIPFEQMVIFGKPLEHYRARVKNRWIYFESIPIPPSYIQDGYAWIDDKFILKQKLSRAGVPTPKCKSVLTWREAERAFESMHKPVIIKPRNGSRGRHTTTNINTVSQLKQAYKLAKEIAIQLVVEEHLFGSVYRGTIVGGELVGFFRADPPVVIGDGIHTVNELIHKKNETKHERLNTIRINDDLIDCIKRQGYTLSNIPIHGAPIALSAKTGRYYGGYTEEMLARVHPKLKTYLEKAGAVARVPVVGFDVIIQNPNEDPDTQSWGVIEANSLPFIDLHYFALEGAISPVASNIWNLWK